MFDEDLWKLEKQFWTEGSGFFKDHLAPDALMVFEKTGIMTTSAILDAVEHAPRWDRVEFTENRLCHCSDDVVVLGYRAAGHRGDEDYQCYCSSSYVRKSGGWEMVQHQQCAVAA